VIIIVERYSLNNWMYWLLLDWYIIDRWNQCKNHRWTCKWS